MILILKHRGINCLHCINRKFFLVVKMKKLPLTMKTIEARYFAENIVLRVLYLIWNGVIGILRAIRLERISVSIWQRLNAPIAMVLDSVNQHAMFLSTINVLKI